MSWKCFSNSSISGSSKTGLLEAFKSISISLRLLDKDDLEPHDEGSLKVCVVI